MRAPLTIDRLAGTVGGLRPLAVAAALVLALGSMGVSPVRPGTGARSPAGDVMSKCDVEPGVFPGTACIYEANPSAADTVVLVHGLGGSAEDWRGQIEPLAKKFHVVTFDLPGFGRSTRGNELYSIENYAAFVHYVLQHHATGSVSLVGHSMGGAIALWYAGAHPDAIERLVLVDAAGVLHQLTLTKQAANAWLAEVLQTVPGAGFLGRMADRMLGEYGGTPVDPALLLHSAQFRERALGGDPARIAGLSVATTNFSPILPRVTAPTLVVWGANDQVASLRTGQLLAARLRRARLVTLAAGHVPMTEDTETFNRVLLAFLEGTDDPAGWQAAEPPPVRADAPRAVCNGRQGVAFEGAYDAVEIRDCTDAIVRNARLRRLDITGSSVTIVDSVIEGGEIGISAAESDVTMTASDVSADVAVRASDSRLDLAGVVLKGKTAAISAPMQSTVILSVSQVESPHTRGLVHESIKITPESPL